MIRISQGKYKGQGVPSPPGKSIRPTTSLIRESIFNRFQFQMKGARFLDLFAGSGIMGLEALSRMADFVLLVERDARQCKLLRRHFATLDISAEAIKIIHYCARDLVAKPCQQEPFDMIFLDPPYGFPHLSEMIKQIEAHGWLTPDGALIVEQSSREAPLEGFDSIKNFGDTDILIKK